MNYSLIFLPRKNPLKPHCTMRSVLKKTCTCKDWPKLSSEFIRILFSVQTYFTLLHSLRWVASQLIMYSSLIFLPRNRPLKPRQNNPFKPTKLRLQNFLVFSPESILMSHFQNSMVDTGVHKKFPLFVPIPPISSICPIWCLHFWFMNFLRKNSKEFQKLLT